MSRFASEVAAGLRCAHERRWEDPCSTCRRTDATIAGLARLEAEMSTVDRLVAERDALADALEAYLAAGHKEARRDAAAKAKLALKAVGR